MQATVSDTSKTSTQSGVGVVVSSISGTLGFGSLLGYFRAVVFIYGAISIGISWVDVTYLDVDQFTQGLFLLYF